MFEAYTKLTTMEPQIWKKNSIPDFGKYFGDAKEHTIPVFTDRNRNMEDGSQNRLMLYHRIMNKTNKRAIRKIYTI